MLTRQNRLHKSKEVKQVLAKGTGFFSPYFLAKKQNSPGSKKFTVVVSTKVSKKAVQRNRIKRILRDEIRQNLNGFQEGAYIFTAKAKIMEIYDTKIASEFISFLKKSKLL